MLWITTNCLNVMSVYTLEFTIWKMNVDQNPSLKFQICPSRTWNQSQMKDESWSKSLIKISRMPDENHEINFHRPDCMHIYKYVNVQPYRADKCGAFRGIYILYPPLFIVIVILWLVWRILLVVSHIISCQVSGWVRRIWPSLASCRKEENKIIRTPLLLQVQFHRPW